MAQTIAVKHEGRYFLKERSAAAVITPGDLVESDGAGGVQVHSTVGGEGQRAFALENDLIGKGIDDDYAASDSVRYGVFPRGAEINANGSEAISEGDLVESAGDGTVRVVSAGGGVAIGVALATTVGAGRVLIEVL